MVKQVILMSGVTLVIMLLLLFGVNIGCTSTTEPISTQPKPTVPANQTQPTVPTIPQSNPVPTPVPAQKQPTLPDANTIALREIVGNPKLYSGKDVVINGVLFNICCGTDFTFKDGIDSIQVVVTEQAPMPQTSKVGSKIKVLGTVKVTYNNVVVVAKEIKFQ